MNRSRGGTLTLGFTRSFYDGDGDDLFIFEVGESNGVVGVEVSDDLNNWYSIGTADQTNYGVDLSGKVPNGSSFHYVRLTDKGTDTSGTWPGADIDTVAALYIR